MKRHNNFSVFALNHKSSWLEDEDQEITSKCLCPVTSLRPPIPQGLPSSPNKLGRLSCKLVAPLKYAWHTWEAAYNLIYCIVWVWELKAYQAKGWSLRRWSTEMGDRSTGTELGGDGDLVSGADDMRDEVKVKPPGCL